MKTNVGLVDRIVRLVVSGVLAVLAFVLGFESNWWLLIPAAILAGTAAISFCGLYAFLGLSTCPRQTK